MYSGYTPNDESDPLPTFDVLNNEGISIAGILTLLGTPASDSGASGRVSEGGDLLTTGCRAGFNRPYTKTASGRHRVNLQSLLLCCPQAMARTLDPSVAAVMAKNPAVELLKWVGHLTELEGTCNLLTCG